MMIFSEVSSHTHPITHYGIGNKTADFYNLQFVFFTIHYPCTYPSLGFGKIKHRIFIQLYIFEEYSCLNPQRQDSDLCSSLLYILQMDAALPYYLA